MSRFISGTCANLMRFFYKFRFDVWAFGHPPLFWGGGGLEKTCFGRYLEGSRWVLGPSKGLEGRTIGRDIIVRRLLKIGNLGTTLVMWAIIHP